ncbi:NAD(P)/FAD-dependent oxidoreductase [Algihabitans albus]|uniref:NAD(P)/FAD-dependent oxidoreductase n=1 Tax=Algihabitans albus TaxID=2164067 RepID=UPI000E5CDD5D|nr:FAD-dependent oxidoreductase [Algihabitans albus]
MKIAVVGSGVAGLGAAWALSADHEVVVYEAETRLGGHSNTVEVTAVDGRTVPVDTGFIVYNERTYPNLIRLFEHLGVATEASNMSFAVSVDRGQFEYAGSAAGLFAQRRNLLRPRLWRLLRDLLRFYRTAPAFLETTGDLPIGEYLQREGYSQAFMDDHLLPMAAAVWSCSTHEVRAFPTKSFLRFNLNHGLMQLTNRPQWRTVSGGSREYVKRLSAPIAAQARLGTPVAAIQRTAAGVTVTDRQGHNDLFDQVVLACHGDQARALLGTDASKAEAAVLSAFRYQPNRTLLHRDPGLMPRRRSVWSSWNYLSGKTADDRRAVSVTYWMNRLQNLDPAVPLFVSLNPIDEPRTDLIEAEFNYDHPVFDSDAVAAQAALPEIQGVAQTWFCGSYCGYGFHEDALQAGFAVAAALGSPVPWASDVVPASPSANIVPPNLRPYVVEPAIAAE